MNLEQNYVKNLCVYQDEATGANPIPLSILGTNLKIKKNSEYFTKSGVAIDLQLNDEGEILKIQLGPDISIDLQTMRDGVEVGPLGLFPVHILQLSSEFSAKEGGVLRFGFLNKIFVKESFSFAVKRMISKLFGLKLNKAFTNEKDLTVACLNHYGSSNWGSFDITVKKTESGGWAVYEPAGRNSSKAVEKIVARFDVSPSGVALGIQGMHCI